MNEPEPHFEDDSLKAAIQRALGSEQASEALRQRVAASLRPTPRTVWRLPLVWTAAAAVLVVGLGLAYVILMRSSDRPAPAWLANAMVEAHDRCAALPDHHLLKNADGSTNQDDLAAIRKKMSADLAHPVAAEMLGDGWTFKGAGICTVSKVPAAHLLFARGDQTISIISVSAGAFYADTSSGGASYAQVANGHPISGFVSGNAIHCLIGSSKSGDLTLKEVTKLRERLRKTVSLAGTHAMGMCSVH